MSIYYCHACERQHDGDYVEQADTEPTMCAEYAPDTQEKGMNTTEPQAITELRHRVNRAREIRLDHAGNHALGAFLEGVLAAYDAIVSERDEWRDAATWAENQHQYWKTVAEAATAQRDEARRLHMVVRNELDTLRARLAACERVVEAALVWLSATGAEASGRADAKLASATYDYRAAVAAETSERSSPITAGDTQGENDVP
jgi:hypothetical protein